jgi:glycerophosphoryl diester phosphodiesterase
VPALSQDEGVSTDRPPPPLPIGFAHRGARAERRDNTVESFTRALELGATALESDVWLTADGVAVLDHDGMVRRGVRRYPIRTMGRDQLPRHIPTLAELYERCGVDFELSLDVKDVTAGSAAVDVAARFGAVGRVWLCGEGPLLTDWRALSGEVRVVASTGAPRMATAYGGGQFRLAAAALGRQGVDAVNLRWPEWDAGRVAAVHQAGMLAFAWDAQRATIITEVLALGVDGVYSDHVKTMTGAIDEWHRQGPARTAALPPPDAASESDAASEPVDAVERPDPGEGPADEELG